MVRGNATRHKGKDKVVFITNSHFIYFIYFLLLNFEYIIVHFCNNIEDRKITYIRPLEHVYSHGAKGAKKELFASAVNNCEET